MREIFCITNLSHSYSISTMFLKSTPNGWVTSGNMFSVLKFVCFLLTFYYLLVSILNSQYCTVLKFVFTFTTYYYFLHFNTMLSAQYSKFTDLSRLYTSYVLLSLQYSHLSGLLHHLIITLPCSFHVTAPSSFRQVGINGGNVKIGIRSYL